MHRPFALTLALITSATLLGPASSVRHLTAPAADYGKLALSFEPNRGQSARGTEFVARGEGYSIGLARGTVKLRVRDSGVDLSFPGSRSTAPAEALEPRPGRVNYFIGNDPSKWLTNLPTYAKVRYRDLYPGVDLVLYGNQRQLEYDLIAKPGVDVGAIALRVDGAEHLDLDPYGALMITLSGGTAIRQHRPDIYQVAHGQRRSIEGGYRLTGEHTVAFWTGAYDQTLPLTIDPVIVYSSAFGGHGSYGDFASSVVVDGFGNAFVAGRTNSDDFPVSRGAAQPAIRNSRWTSGFVAKIDATGATLEYATYLGGNNSRLYDNNSEGANAVAIDGAGNAYVTGSTTSTDFPTVNAFQLRMQNDISDGMDAFVTKLNPTGSALIYSTYLGGQDSRSNGSAVVVDGLGNAHVGGWTEAQQFPGTMIGPPTDRKQGFVTKFNPVGGIVYSTSLNAVVNSIALDQAGRALVVGSVYSYPPSKFPVLDGSTSKCLSRGIFCSVGFLARLSVSGSQMVYSTLLGGEAEPDASTSATSVAVDGAGNAYVAGMTSSSALRTKNAFRPTFGGGRNDAFAASFAPDGVLRYFTYLGGSGDDGYDARIAVDPQGNAYVTGSTLSTDFPLTKAIVDADPAGPIFSSVGRDAAWTASGKGITSSVSALVLDPLKSGVMYAGTQGDGVFKTTNAGANWSAVTNGFLPGDLSIQAVALDPRATETLYATASGGRVYKTVDGGARWQRVFAATLSLGFMAIDPLASDVVYAGGRAGLYRTVDAGRTWTTVHTGVVNAVAVDPSSPGVVYLLAFPPGQCCGVSSLYKSLDKGASWTAMNFPIIRASDSWRTALVVDPANPATLYVGWKDSSLSNDGPSGLLRSLDGGAHWTSMFDRPVTAMVLAPRRQEMYISTVPRTPGQPCVLRSRDGGQTWGPPAAGLYSGASVCEINAIAIDPVSPTTLYAGAHLRDVTYLTRLTPDGAVAYSTYLPISSAREQRAFAIAADIIGNAYIAGATPAIQPGGSYGGRALVMKVAPWPATTPCRSLDSNDQHCLSPPREIRPSTIDRR